MPVPVRPPGRGADPARRHTPAVGAGSTGADDALTVDSLGMVGRFRRRKRAIAWPVMHALWSTGGTRVLTGFIILYLAFLTREQPVGWLGGPGGPGGTLVLGIVALAIGVGNALGSVLGNRLQAARPERTAMLALLAATLTCLLAGVWYAVVTLALVGFAQGVSAQLSKLCLDALVQRDVPERVRTSVFAWSETVLQMLWVVGGGLGIVLPLEPHVGFSVCAVAMAAAVVLAARQRRDADHRGAPRAAHGRLSP